MTCTIRRGLAVSTDVPAAAEAFQLAVDMITDGVGDSASAMSAALRADPSFVLPRLALSDDGTREPMNIDAGARERLTDWERSHLELGLLRRGAPDRQWALQALAHVQRFPGDAWMYDSLHTFALYFGGAELRSLVAALTSELIGKFPHDDYYRSRWSFCLTEMGFAERGLRVLGRMQIRRPLSSAAWHCRVHALHGLGRHDEVLEICEDLRGRGGKFECHLAWHEALVRLGRGEASAALALYQDRCGPGVNVGAEPLALADVTGFAWAFMAATGGPPPGTPALHDHFASIHAPAAADHVALQRAALGGVALPAGALVSPREFPFGDLTHALVARDWPAVDRALRPLAGLALEEVGGSRLQLAVVALIALTSAGHQGDLARGVRDLERVVPHARRHPVVAARLREIDIAA